jgi:hypothetical protein
MMSGEKLKKVDFLVDSFIFVNHLLLKTKKYESY